MPISLITGLPGHGKTAYLISLFLKWEQEGLKRKIYVVGEYDSDAQGNDEDIQGIVFLRELKLDIKFITYADIVNWEDFEKGSLIVIDEAQEIFKQRMKGEAPQFITRLSKHRHGGFDFILLTQDPRLLDAWARKLIDSHQHIKRLFGSNFQAVFTWSDKCSEAPRDKKEQRTAITSITRIPKKVFGVYKSASSHTIKSSVPLKLKLSAFMFLLVPIAGYFFVTNTQMFKDVKTVNDGGVLNSSGSSSASTTAALTKLIAPNLSNKTPVPVYEDQLLIDQQLKYYGYLKVSSKHGLNSIDLKLIHLDKTITNLTLSDLRSEPDLTFSFPTLNKIILKQSGRIRTLYKINQSTNPYKQQSFSVNDLFNTK